jgi:cell division septum initiation protein DivIVA
MSDFYDHEDEDGELDLTPPAVGDQYHPAEAETLLVHLRDVIAGARPVPLSASSMISKDEVLNLIDDVLQQLPEELRAARWLLKERAEFINSYKHEAEEIVAKARARAESMVQRTEVVAAAEQRAYEIVDTAQSDARRLRHEVEDFCDQKLASFEIVLERTQKLVTAGRSKLQGTNLLAEAAAAAVAETSVDQHTDQHADQYSDEYEGQQSTTAERDSSYDDDSWGAPATSSGVYDEYADLSPAALDAERYDDAASGAALADGSLPYGDADPFGDRDGGTGRLGVVRDRYADLPPPPDADNPTIRDAAATFFDQDLA